MSEYQKPSLDVLGPVDAMTRQDGSSFTDLPEGTPVGDGNVAGDPGGVVISS